MRRQILMGAVSGLALLVVPGQTMASSHREAPGITEMPKVDNTDVYAFRSYEPGRAGYVTLIANFQPERRSRQRSQLLHDGSRRDL